MSSGCTQYIWGTEKKNVFSLLKYFVYILLSKLRNGINNEQLEDKHILE